MTAAHELRVAFHQIFDVLQRAGRNAESLQA
jgi:hypothetical protein